jgi:hypothetical protein
MSGDELARDVAPWAVQIAAAWRLGTGMGAGARLTGNPVPLPAYEAELERARGTFADPGSVTRLTRAIALDVASSHPAARAAMEAFCRGLAAAATAEGPVPDLPDSYARKGLAAMLTSEGADSPGTRGREAETAAWPRPPAAVPPPQPPRRRAALPGRRGTARFRQGRALLAGRGRAAPGMHGRQPALPGCFRQPIRPWRRNLPRRRRKRVMDFPPTRASPGARARRRGGRPGWP